MSKRLSQLTVGILLILPFLISFGQAPKVPNSSAALDDSTKFELVNADTKWVEYRGRHALKLAPLPGHEHAQNEELMAILADSDFKNGTIELDVSGARRAGYSAAKDERGFKGMIGVSFHIQGDKRETIYVRPENARLNDQVFRNRSTQYESIPDFPWNLLREQSPGVYESYVDLEPGAWTKLRIEVSGTKARLYVNGATQPCLVVNDLKLGEARGKIALWSRVSTDAYFSNLRVEPAP